MYLLPDLNIGMTLLNFIRSVTIRYTIIEHSREERSNSVYYMTNHLNRNSNLEYVVISLLNDSLWLYAFPLLSLYNLCLDIVRNSAQSPVIK